jgi:hypothetical protein
MDLENTVVIFITDKTGCEMFKEYVHKDYADSAKRNLQNHLDSAKLHPEYYHFLDVETARIEIYKI